MNQYDFEIRETVNFRTFNMEQFISNRTTPLVSLIDHHNFVFFITIAKFSNSKEIQFNWQEQMADDEILADLIVNLVRETHEFQWIKHIQRFICALLKSKKATYLVAKTVIRLYVEAAMRRNDAAVTQQMTQTCRYLSSVIAEEEFSAHILDILCDTFFDMIKRRPEIIRNDEQGCEEIIVRFLSSGFNETILKALKLITECGCIRVHGERILRFCSRIAIVDELVGIIENVKGIKIQKAALELACRIEQ